MLKKYLLSVIIFSVFSLQSSAFSPAYAAPAYGTHMPEKQRWTCGLERNFIVDRNMDNDQGASSVDKYFVTCSYGIFQWLSFDGKIGVGNVDWDRASDSRLHYATDFAGGYGFRLKGPESEIWGLKSVVGFQHISVHPDARNQEGTKHETIIDEWQGSLLVSKDIGSLVPYLGARYGSVDFIKWENEHDRKRIQSEKYYGVIIGLDFWLSDKLKLNLEGAFADGEEYAAGFSYDF
ncbi:MAG: hypothetical protein KKC66_06720 [Candidatus Omnitrophica bacterium]|nr:hypothetical protein [Candidatus Omnitrophota bacterium]MBU1933575.1 hypothetical protein [Candidatus Omnitrophota bacterium]